MVHDVAVEPRQPSAVQNASSLCGVDADGRQGVEARAVRAAPVASRRVHVPDARQRDYLPLTVERGATTNP